MSVATTDMKYRLVMQSILMVYHGNCPTSHLYILGIHTGLHGIPQERITFDVEYAPAFLCPDWLHVLSGMV